jgi:hypothetical protein
MFDLEFRALARGFRARAEELLLRAATMRDLEVCLKLREIAMRYERLAHLVEQRSNSEIPANAAAARPEVDD